MCVPTQTPLENDWELLVSHPCTALPPAALEIILSLSSYALYHLRMCQPTAPTILSTPKNVWRTYFLSSLLHMWLEHWRRGTHKSAHTHAQARLRPKSCKKNDLVSKYHAPQGYHYSGWVVLQGDTPGSVHNKSERSENSFFLSKPNTFKYQGGRF